MRKHHRMGTWLGKLSFAQQMLLTYGLMALVGLMFWTGVILWVAWLAGSTLGHSEAPSHFIGSGGRF